MSRKAPKARNVTAQGHALGLQLINLASAEGANYQPPVRLAFRVCIISRLQRSTRHIAATWAAGPGYYISRPWRFRLISVALLASLLAGSVPGQKKYQRPTIK